MDDKKETSREEQGGENEAAQTKSTPPYCTAIQARNPFTGKIWPVFIRDRTLEIVGKRRQPGFALELGRIVQETVLNPTAIFKGVTDYDREDGEEDWLVYAARPTWAYRHETGQQVNPWKGEEIFLVFFDGDRILQMPWLWTAPDPKNTRLPIDFDNGRFRERLL